MFLRTFFRKNPLNLQLLFSHRFSTNSAPIISHDSHDHEAPHQEEHGASHDHGHGHHVKEYDWRDDPKINKELYVDIRDKGWNPDEYTFPYEGKMEWYRIFPENYDQSNLKLNFYSNRKKNENAVTSMRAPYWDPEADVNHEADYESEDMDFQAESFKLQHFKKQGPLTPWIIAAFLPFIFFWAEFILQHYPDEDHWRMAHTPPLDFPDTDDTDDTLTYNDYKSKEGRYYLDTGIIRDIWYDIKDGKKVYRRFAGVNQPLPL